MAATMSWGGGKVKEMGEVKKEKGKEKEGGWVEAANPWKMWWVKSAVRRNYCQLLEVKDRQPTLRACLLLKQTDLNDKRIRLSIPTSPSNVLCMYCTLLCYRLHV